MTMQNSRAFSVISEFDNPKRELLQTQHQIVQSGVGGTVHADVSLHNTLLTRLKNMC